jgi:PAS domain-containing protein
LFATDDRAGVTRSLESARERFAGRIEADHRIRRMDGDVLWSRVYLTPVLDPSGQAFHLLCLLEDVAETPEDRGSG